MNEEPLFTLRNRWFRTSVAGVLSIAVIAAIFGFLVFPALQPRAGYASVWDAICGAAGVFRAAPGETPATQPDQRATQVIVTAQMLPPPDSVSIGRGGTLALRCTMCHGARGLSRADSPNLSGQYASVTYKELMDFKSGARSSAIMEPIVADLTEQDARELAAYYAYLPRLPAYHPSSDGPPPRIVVDGAPMRNVAPCGACHGEIDSKTSSPWLDGQPAPYIAAQLRAFTSGTRRNDIDGQMRNVARHLTDAEIEEAARYYASQPP